MREGCHKNSFNILQNDHLMSHCGVEHIIIYLSNVKRLQYIAEVR